MSAEPTTIAPSAVPTAQTYVVQPGDSLIGVAQRFGLTIDQLLAANPQIADPDQIRAGDILTIPAPGAPSGLPRANGISDPAGDLVDLGDQPTFAPGFIDIRGLGARLDPETIFIELLMVATPPAADPDIEQVEYTVNIDVDDDGEPDFRLRASNTLQPDVDYAAVLVDLTTGATTDAGAFPGTFTVVDRAVRFEVQRSFLRDARRFAIAATAERRFYPGGVTDPEVEAAVDRSPDQQWPRANPRWVEFGIG